MLEQGRPNFGDNFDYLNDRKTQPGGGRTKGYVKKVYYDSHRVDVFLPQYNHTIIGIRVGTRWHAGSGTGEHVLPPIGSECQVIFNQGKSYGMTQADVAYLSFSSDYKPPSHPAMEDQENYFVRQGAIVTGDDVTPGTFEMWDNQGNKHELLMGKLTRRGRGITDHRDDGLSITQTEAHLIESKNTTALAAIQASNLDPTADPMTLAAGFSSLSNTLAQANQITSAAAGSFADQMTAHATSLNVGANAAAIATGQTLSDSL